MQSLKTIRRGMTTSSFLTILLPHCFLGFFQAFLFDFTVDDAFITLRYARNLVSSGNLAYNIGGAPIEGYSNFLLLVILVPIVWVGIDSLLFVKLFGICCAHATLVVMRLSAGRISRDSRHIFIPAMILSLIPGFAVHSVSGMETALYILLLSLLGFIYLGTDSTFTHGHIPASVIMIAIGLTRIEGSVIVAAILVFVFLKMYQKKQPRQILRYSGVFAFLGIYHFWRLLYFGSIFPSTTILKAPDLLFVSFNGMMQSLEFLLFCSLYLLAALISFDNSRFSETDSDTIWILLFALVGVTWFFNPVMGYELRFIFPAIVPILLLSQPFYEQTLDALAHVRENYQWPLIPKRLQSPGVPLIMFLMLFPLTGLQGITYYSSAYPSGLQNAHISLASWLNSNAESNALVGIGDIGAVGYYTNFRILDLNGLVEPAVLEGGYNSSYVYSKEPDYLVILSVSSEHLLPLTAACQNLVNHSRFMNYSRVEVFSFSYSSHLWLYRQNP